GPPARRRHAHHGDRRQHRAPGQTAGGGPQGTDVAQRQAGAALNDAAFPALTRALANRYAHRDMSTENLPQSPEQPPRKPRVAVVCGGRSSEHGISVVTAGAVLRAIDRSKYEVLPIGITQDGRWALKIGRAHV